MITTYFVVSALYPLSFALFFNALLSYAGVTANTWTGIAGGVFSVIVIGFMNHSNVKLSSAIIGTLMGWTASRRWPRSRTPRGG